MALDDLVGGCCACAPRAVIKVYSPSASAMQSVRVCMVDTGFDYFHPDLAANLWTNTNEIPNNGIDDDNNGGTLLRCNMSVELQPNSLQQTCPCTLSSLRRGDRC